MKNNYTQTVLVLNASSFEKDGKETYSYIVAANVWRNDKMNMELVKIRSDIRHSVGQTIFIKSNKSKEGNIYFTEIKVEDKLMEELPL